MFDPVKSSKNIRDEFVDYISTSFSFADKNLRDQFILQLNENISSGPWLEIDDIFKSGKSINELIDEGVLSRLFRELERDKPNTIDKSLPLDRKLYLHQEKAIRLIAGGDNVVISTGTGSGKTNCFLIPVLNDLLKEKENGTLGSGVRALFIYPMNALANDQMKNLRKILMNYTDITFGVYNGNTENKENEAIAVYEAMFAGETIPELRHRLKNELLSREEMKKTPPNILFTNYAMLEHLLFRPNDDVLFSNSDFRFVVLDEAHVYSGATGIETSILLRRLKARITSKRETQFILTSATLGTGKESDADILMFAKNLCGANFNENDIIRGTREKYIPNNNGNIYSSEIFKELDDESLNVVDILNKHYIKHNETLNEEELLYDFLIGSKLYNDLRIGLDKLNSKVNSLYDIEKILGVDEDTAISFISICTKAKKNGKLLIDARYHFFVRSLEGCYLSLSPNKKLFLTRQKKYFYDKKEYTVFEIALCDECGKYALVGQIKDKHLLQASKMNEEVEYFYFASDLTDEVEDEEDETKFEFFYLCPHCGAVVSEYQIKNMPCDCDSNDHIKIVKAKILSNGARCGNCQRGTYQRFYLGNDAATSVLATSLYEELPEIEYVAPQNRSIIKNNLFVLANSNKKVERKVGRQFLAFSDSRQEAAKFACYLSKSYNEFLRRRGICHIIKENKDEIINNIYTISDFAKKLTNYFSNKKTFAESNNDNSNLTTISSENAWVAILNELARYNSPTSLTSLGVIQFKYLGNTNEIISKVAETYNVKEETAENLLNLLIFEIVKMGAIVTDSDTDINDNDRDYIFHTPSQKFVTMFQSPENKKITISNWKPKHKKGKDNEYYKTNRLYYVTKFLNIGIEEAVKFLEQYFYYLTDTDSRNSYLLIDKNKDKTYVIPAKFFQVKISEDKTSHWYKCKKCGKISQFNLNGHCTIVNCNGVVEEIAPASLNKNNHYAKLYFSNRMTPLFIKEHTAQLSKKESALYQEQFVKKEINALSCSTTFEMGVDVGGLETVFLRDVPPLPANYAQRAGRAGRSINSVAYALTFARLSSHDLSFFKEPKKMINGIIFPPLFKVDNEKIVRRHIYAVALSMFFADHPDMYDHNSAEKFLNNKGYLEFINWINTKPNRLKDMLKRSIPNIENLHNRMGIDDFSWIKNFSGEEGSFTFLIKEYENNIAEFEKLINKFKKNNEFENAAKCEKKLNIYKDNKLIDFLARGNVLPRYGFPVDTVELEQNTTANNINKLRLSRDLSIAIAEYAPSSEVIADGKMYTSRYIKKTITTNNQRGWNTAYIGICNNPECQAINYSITPISDEGCHCSSCGGLLTKFDFHESIEPRSGFVTERKAKDVPLSSQEKNYKSADYYIGNTESKTIDKRKFKFNNILVTIESTTNDSLMVKSTNNFYVCSKCGYALAEDESLSNDKEAKKAIAKKAYKITTAKKHESLFGQYDCECTELYRYSLHHVFNTDVAKINFDCDTSNYKTMISTMYAILYSVSDMLNIERKDIKTCLSLKIINNRASYSIIIYDAVPGGAGHSRRLVTKDGIILYKVIERAYHNMNSCNCDPSCYNCLRSYENQRIHEDLNRNLAADFLGKLLGNIETVD